MSSTTVIIPTYGRPDLLEKCIKAVPEDYPIIAVDDATPGEDATKIVQVCASRVKLFRHKVNVGFPATVNWGVSKAKTPYVLILNTDVELLSPDVIPILESNMDQDVGIAAPMLIFPPDTPYGPAGTIQHVGMVFNIWGVPVHLFIGWHVDNPRAVKRRDTLNCATGACMLIRRSLWVKYGGFAEEYGRGTYEDVEFCLKLRIGGSKIVVDPEARATHAVGQSSAVQHKGFDLEQNLRLFHYRMGTSLVNDDYLYW